MHKLLLRQIRHYLGERFDIPSNAWSKLLSAISRSYKDFDRDHDLVEHSLDLMSKELNTINEELRDQVHQKEKAMEQFQQIANNIQEIFWIRRVDNGTFTYVSPAVHHILGCTAEEMVLEPERWIDAIDDEFREYFRVHLHNAQHKGFDTTYRITDAAGNIRWIRDRGFPISEAGEKVTRYAGLAEDITDAKMLDKAKTEFVALASHQLRTPLSTIRWSFEILLEKTDNLSETQRYLFENAYSAALRMTETVSSMLLISRIEAQSLKAQTEQFSLCSLIEDVQKEYAIKYTQKKITNTTSCASDISLRSDPQLLKEIIMNLVSNAIQYTPEGGTVSISTEKNDHHAMIKVSDNGIGIPQSDQEKIFRKLYRGKNAKDVYTSGTGLGLYTAQSICPLLGAEIRFESVENKGSTFILTLPLS